ncbi:MAG: sigma-70 family RNA polymerase sigma factor [Bacteroidetes bacterium]|nr:sigma-70 family RNA polymerase sigma factor [Bacteroidota bacterium]
MAENIYTDEEIIRKVVDGDRDAFRLIVRKYQSTVAGICFNMLKDENLADEVGQDVFIRLFKSLAHFRFESSLKTYVSRIAMNLCLNKLKQQNTWWNRFSGTSEDLELMPTKSAAHDFENKEILAKALQQLDDKPRALVVLRMIEGYSIKETAEILEIREGTVMSGLKRALDKLKNILEKLGYE